MIERNVYLNKLIESKENGFLKVITGIRRCGKSYLLEEIYFRQLSALNHCFYWDKHIAYYW